MKVLYITSKGKVRYISQKQRETYIKNRRTFKRAHHIARITSLARLKKFNKITFAKIEKEPPIIQQQIIDRVKAEADELGFTSYTTKTYQKIFENFAGSELYRYLIYVLERELGQEALQDVFNKLGPVVKEIENTYGKLTSTDKFKLNTYFQQIFKANESKISLESLAVDFLIP